jgi:hypothetical protein
VLADAVCIRLSSPCCAVAFTLVAAERPQAAVTAEIAGVERRFSNDKLRHVVTI